VRIALAADPRANVTTGVPVLDHLIGVLARTAGLDVTLEVAPQDTRVDEPCYSLELRERLAPQVRDVLIRERSLGEPAPMPLNHARASSGSVPDSRTSASIGSGLVLRDTTQSGRDFSVNRGALAQALNEM
jgi:hypothetical protein